MKNNGRVGLLVYLVLVYNFLHKDALCCKVIGCLSVLQYARSSTVCLFLYYIEKICI